MQRTILRYSVTTLFALLTYCGNANGQALQTEADWLVNPAPFKARVTMDKAANDLVLDNGLARRVIKLSPNAATTDLQCLSSGEHLIRAISPEARVTINGNEYKIGGLEGQKVKNYVDAASLDSLRDTSNSYHFAGVAEGPIEARMQWKKHVEWMGRDLPWPPPGRHVVMRYAPPAAPSGALEGAMLFGEKFGQMGQLDGGWTIHASPSLPRASFTNEGKTGEIMAIPDTCVYAERAWPQGAVSAEVEVDTGDDKMSNSWGPGLSIVAKDGSVESFVARPNSQTFEVDDVESKEGFDRSKPCAMRMRIDKGSLVCEAAQEDGQFKEIARTDYTKTPATIRIGKVGKGGAPRDYPGAGGTPIRCHVLEIALRGPEPAHAVVSRGDLPEVDVHYEIYDGIPLISKWLVVKNTTGKTVRVNKFEADELRLFEAEARGGDSHGPGSERERPNIYVETDMAFGGRMYAAADNHAVKLDGDPEYSTHVNYSYAPPTLLTVAPRAWQLPGEPVMGPDQDVPPGASLETFRTFELLLDSDERERRTLAQRKMYRVIAPWTQENPLMFATVRADPASVRSDIDQASQTGFELISLSFGSGFDFESTDEKYWDTYKGLASEARAHGISIAGYSLLASRGAADPKDNATGPCEYGVMPCLGSKWGQLYLADLGNFIKYTGIGLENDGSYPGDLCSSHDHPGHHGLEDSQWVMWRGITNLYKECRAEGVYLGVPDWYPLTGSNKCAMGYRETNWSLPRADQVLIERQNIFDGTWTKTPSMGWMFVPLTEYHGGGAAATMEPLDQHLEQFDARFADNLGAGVQASYRGWRLYDTDRTKALEQKWVTFYKAHREVLDEDIIHLRRANGLDWDGILHVNPQGKENALGFFYNPLPEDIEREIRIPLHYAGLAGTAQVSLNGGAPQAVALDGEQATVLKLRIPAHGYTYAIFTATR